MKEKRNKMLDWREILRTTDPLELVVAAVTSLCVITIFMAILTNFIESRAGAARYWEKRSLVATGTMTLFFLFYFILLRFKIGFVPLSREIRIIMAVPGLLCLIFSCGVNLTGRIQLGRNWSNHIRIYEAHTFVARGVYKMVRHPLYASIIWMFYAGSLVYLNWAAFLATNLVFIPLMYYRAKQEEQVLARHFKEYERYKKNTGMFFPKIFKRRRRNEQ